MAHHAENKETKSPIWIYVVLGSIILIGTLWILYRAIPDFKALADTGFSYLQAPQLTIGQTILYIGLPLMAVGAITAFTVRLFKKTNERKEGYDFYDSFKPFKKEVFKTIKTLLNEMRESRQIIYAIAIASIVALGIILASNGPLLAHSVPLGSTLLASVGITAGFYLLLHAFLYLEKESADYSKHLAIQNIQKQQKRDRQENNYRYGEGI
jgi:hypothetical protein